MTTYQLTILILIVTLSVVPWIILYFFGSTLKKWWKKRFNKSSETMLSVHEISASLNTLQKNKKGATFVIRQNDSLRKYIVDAVEMNSELSSDLLTTIFISDKSPLHDGAAVIDGTLLTHASAFITTLSKEKLPRNFGTRHRSALGLTEVSDSIAIVLSEETGKVTIFKGSTFTTVESIADISSVITDKLIGIVAE